MPSNRHNKWLAAESSSWVHEGLISAEQAKLLRDRYAANAGMSWGLFLLSAIGAIIFGLGIILFFAYNWADLPKFAKLALIFTALVVAHVAGLFVSSKHRNNQNLREGFHVLGTLMFGAGIWLIAQVYHIDEHYPNAFAFWGLGALALAWAMPSVIQGLIATVLIATWGFAENAGFNKAHYLSVAIMVIGVLPLAWHLKSRVLLFFSLVATLGLSFTNVLLKFDEEIIFYLLFAMATLLICFARLARYSSFPASGDVLRTIGIAGYGLLLFIASFEDATRALIQQRPEDSAYLFSGGILGLALVSWIVLAIHMRKLGASLTKFAEIILVLITIMLTGLLLIGAFNEHHWLGVLLINGVLACHCILLIIIGTDEVNWRHVAVGCLTLALLVFMRFNDLFESLLMRSMVFLVVGAILFFIGHIYAKQNAQKKNDDPTLETPRGTSHA